MLKIKIGQKLEEFNTQKKDELKEMIDADVVKFEDNVKGLISYEGRRDQEILNGLGENSANNRIQQAREEEMAMNAVEKVHGLMSYSLTDIRTMCMKYRLRFLSTKLFKGMYAVEVAGKIKQLEKTIQSQREVERANRMNITVEEFRAKGEPEFKFDSTDLKDKFFVMAPPKMFDLTTEPAPPKVIVNYDPVLFYHYTDAAKDMYLMIHAWGKDFTILRRAKGLFYQSFGHAFAFIMAIVFPVVLYYANQVMTYWGANSWPALAYWAVTVVGSLVVAFIAAISTCGSIREQRWSETHWNSSWK